MKIDSNKLIKEINKLKYKSKKVYKKSLTEINNLNNGKEHDQN